MTPPIGLLAAAGLRITPEPYHILCVCVSVAPFIL